MLNCGGIGGGTPFLEDKGFPKKIREKRGPVK